MKADTKITCTERDLVAGCKNCVELQYRAEEVVSDSFNFIGRCNSSAPNVDERQADEQLFS